jgi:hypothetical protein
VSTTTRNIVAGVVAVVAALALIVAVVRLSEDGTVEVRLGDDEFRVGNAEALSDRTPFLVPDLLDDGQRDLVVFHLDDDPRTGWLAMEVTRGDGCAAEQDRETLEVRDGCTGEVIDPTTSDRTRYPARVDDGELVVDLTPDGVPGGGGGATTVATPTT